MTTVNLRIEAFVGAARTDLQRPLRVLERTIDSHFKRLPALLRIMFKSRAGEPFWDVLDLSANCQRGARTKESGMERTYRERVDKKCARNHSSFCVPHCVFRSLQESVLMRFYIQPISDFEDQRADHA